MGRSFIAPVAILLAISVSCADEKEHRTFKPVEQTGFIKNDSARSLLRRYEVAALVSEHGQGKEVMCIVVWPFAVEYDFAWYPTTEPDAIKSEDAASKTPVEFYQGGVRYQRKPVEIDEASRVFVRTHEGELVSVKVSEETAAKLFRQGDLKAIMNSDWWSEKVEPVILAVAKKEKVIRD